MGCRFFRTSAGESVWVCTRGGKPAPICASCGRVQSSKQCDFHLGGAQADKTCDRFLCAGCSASWSLVAPVQPSPEYRREHGGDLCRVHIDMVAKGIGPAMLNLLSLLRAGNVRGQDLAGRLEHAPLESRPTLLDGGAAHARLFLAGAGAGRTDAPATRLRILGEAMENLATSLRRAGDPVATYEAARRAEDLLRPLLAVRAPVG